MKQWRWLISGCGAFVVACAHTPPAAIEQNAPPARLDEGWDSRHTRPRVAIQVNDEPAFIRNLGGGDGGPMMYRGKPITADRVKTINIIKAKEARERFGDPNLDYALLIELK